MLQTVKTHIAHTEKQSPATHAHRDRITDRRRDGHAYTYRAAIGTHARSHTDRLTETERLTQTQHRRSQSDQARA